MRKTKFLVVLFLYIVEVQGKPIYHPVIEEEELFAVNCVTLGKFDTSG